MLNDIPSPPAMPTQYVLAAGAVAVVLGLGLVLAGRRLARLFIALVGAAAAVASVPLYIDLLPYHEYVPVAIGSAVAGLIVGLLLSRLVWAALLGTTVGMTALWAMIQRNAATATSRPAEWASYDLTTFAKWLGAVADYHFRWFVSLWPQYNVTLALWVLLPALAFLVAGLVLPSGAIILMSSLLGAAAVVGGAMALMKPEWQSACREHFSTVLAAAGALALVGLIVQVCGEIAAHAREAEKEEKEEAGKSDKPEKASKPDKTEKSDKAKESSAKKD